MLIYGESNEENALRAIEEQCGIRYKEKDLKFIATKRYRDRKINCWANIYLLELDTKFINTDFYQGELHHIEYKNLGQVLFLIEKQKFDWYRGKAITPDS